MEDKLSFAPIKRLAALWRIRTLRLVVLVSTVVAATAGFLSQVRSIADFITDLFRAEVGITLERTPDFDIDAKKAVITGHLLIRKSGEPPAYKCRFEGWVGNQRADLMLPTQPFSIPPGKFEKVVWVTLKDEQLGLDYAEDMMPFSIQLSCQNMVSNTLSGNRHPVRH